MIINLTNRNADLYKHSSVFQFYNDLIYCCSFVGKCCILVISSICCIMLIGKQIWNTNKSKLELYFIEGSGVILLKVLYQLSYQWSAVLILAPLVFFILFLLNVHLVYQITSLVSFMSIFQLIKLDWFFFQVFDFESYYKGSFSIFANKSINWNLPLIYNYYP